MQPDPVIAVVAFIGDMIGNAVGGARSGGAYGSGRGVGRRAALALACMVDIGVRLEEEASVEGALAGLDVEGREREEQHMAAAVARVSRLSLEAASGGRGGKKLVDGAERHLHS